MTSISDEELGAVIYTELLGYSEPSSVSEMCDKITGLRKRQDRVAKMLSIMCARDIVVNVGSHKYILKEKWTPQIGRNSSPLACDGPAYGITCSDRHSDSGTCVCHEDRLPTVLGAVWENSVMTAQASSVVPQAHSVAPQASRVETQAPNLVQHTSRSVPQASREMVPVQQSVVRRSSSLDSTCDNATLELNRDVLTKIVDLLQRSSCPLKAKDIAQGTGIGQARSSVNRYLYFLEGHNILKKIGQTEWSLVKKVKDEDLHVYAAELAKSPTGKSKGKQSAGSAGSGCPCPNAGPQCLHVTNNFQQNVTKNYYNVQVGENNQMVSVPPPDGAPDWGGN